MSDSTPYRPLKEYVTRRGGVRLLLHPGIRDALVELAVREFPSGADPDKLAEVLKARMKIRIRETYSSPIAVLIIGVILNAVVRIIIEWWMRRHAHRVLMEGWHNALARSHVPGTGLQAPRRSP